MVREVGMALPDVEASTKYDGSPVLKLGGCFLAGLAMDGSAEPDTLVVRCLEEVRDQLIADAPGAYYVTGYHRRYPVVLVRLGQVDRAALRELLTASWQLTLPKARIRGRGKARKAGVSRGEG